MKINIMAPSTSTVMGGGIRVIFRHANYLVNRGHDVVLYVPMLFYIGRKFILRTSLANTFKRGTKIRWTEAHFQVRLAWKFTDRYVRDADIVMATTWYTAPFVDALSPQKGKKVYFIQGYEIWNQDEAEVAATYRMNMHRIVVTRSLHDLLKAKFNVESDIVYNGHSENEYLLAEKRENNPRVIMMLWNSAWFKGCQEALKILMRMHEKFGISAIFFSVEPTPPQLPSFVEFYHRPERSDLIELYRRADIYLFPSNSESWGLPVIEAMANKCAVVGMNTGCLADACHDGQQALIASCNDYWMLEQKLEILLSDAALIRKLQQNGYAFARGFSWNRQCPLFEASLRNLLTDS